MIDFLTPEGAVVALAVVAPLAALLVLVRRARVVRRVLGLRAPERPEWIVPAAALASFAGLVGVAAAQPAVTETRREAVRTDVEAFFVIDTSRSMLAASGQDGERRIDRAKAAAVALRNAIGDVPAGIASLTDRALPHLYPSADKQVFAQTMRRVVDVEHPPPLAPGARATSFDPLEAFAGSDLFFSPTVDRRLVVVLSDAEVRQTDASLLAARIKDGAPLRVVFVHVWDDGEQIFSRDGTPEAAYRADPTSGPQLAELARLLDARTAGEDELDAAAAAVRSAAGVGEATRRVERVETVALAPYAILASFAPLALLLWRRNRA
jgi:hypothetical protein